MKLHFDDEDEGLSPDTSHPRFVELAPESFYDEGNDFGPFGSDDGNDTLREMESWYEARVGRADPSEFLTELVENWDFDLPAGVMDYADEELIAFARDDDMNEVYVSSVARACVAAALGQLKIEGVISLSLQSEGRKGLRVLRTLTADTSLHPDWPHRAEALRGLDEIETVLAAAIGRA